MASEKIELLVPEEFNLERIDKFLTASIELDWSRSYIQKLIKGDFILVNENSIKSNYKVKTDDEIVISIPKPRVLDLKPQDIPIDIIFEDDDIAVINKQPGLVVHPGPGNWDGTLVNALLFHLTNLSGIGGVERPGIVHRLDKDTSGLMIVAKSDLAHRNLVEDFSERRVFKEYHAVVVGKPKGDTGIIEEPIARHKKYRHKMTIDENGKFAKTGYEVEKIWSVSKGIFSLLHLNLFTGRTHQIRVHLSANGSPIVGDPIYSKKWEKHRVPFLLLAATKLKFTHPITKKEMSFEIDFPEHMKFFVEKLDYLRSLPK